MFLLGLFQLSQILLCRSEEAEALISWNPKRIFGHGDWVLFLAEEKRSASPVHISVMWRTETISFLSPDFASHCVLMVLVSQSNNEKVTGITEKDVKRGSYCKLGWSLEVMCNRFCCQAGCRGTLTERTAVSEPFTAGWTHIVSMGSCSLTYCGNCIPQ